jgi:hypothetical protein
MGNNSSALQHGSEQVNDYKICLESAISLTRDLQTCRSNFSDCQNDMEKVYSHLATQTVIASECKAKVLVLDQDVAVASAALTACQSATCGAGLVQVNGKCELPPNSHLACNANYTLLLDKTRCAANCTANATMDMATGICQCKAGFTQLTNGSCVANCQGSHKIMNLSTGECMCSTGYTMLADGFTCAANCPSQQSLDSQTGKCVCNDASKTLDVATGVCTCNSGLTLLDDGRCVQSCGQAANMNTSTGQCVCPVNYTLMADQRSCGVSCVGNAIWDPISGTCSCPANHTLLNSSVACAVNCGANATLNLNTGVCQCPSGFTLLDDKRTCMKDCGTGATMDKATGKCLCAPGSSLLSDARNCAKNCSANQTRNESTGACSCNLGYTMLLDNATCAANCGDNAVMNQSTGVCSCKNNYIFTSDGKNCALNCGQAKQLDPVTDTCVCVAGFSQLTDGRCERSCGANGIFNTTTGKCTCPTGFTMLADGRTCEDTMARYYPILSPQLTSTDLVFAPNYFAVVSTGGIGGQMVVRPYDSKLGFISLNANVTVALTDPVARTDPIIGLKFGMLPNAATPTASFYKVDFSDATITFSPFMDALFPGKYGMRVTAATRTGTYTYDYAAGKWALDEYSLFEVKMSMKRLLTGKDEIVLTINGINTTGPIGVYTYTISAGTWAPFTKFNFYNAKLETGGLCRVFATSNPAILSSAYANSSTFFSCRNCDPATTTCRFGACYPNECVIGNDARPECGGQYNCPAGQVAMTYRGDYFCSLPHECNFLFQTCPSDQQCMQINGINKCMLNGVPVDPSGSAYVPLGTGGGGGSAMSLLQDITRGANILELAGYPPHMKTQSVQKE